MTTVVEPVVAVILVAKGTVPSERTFLAPKRGGDFLFVTLVNEVYNDFYHYVFFLGFALGYHQGQSNEGVVGQAFCAVWTIEYEVVVEEPKE